MKYIIFFFIAILPLIGFTQDVHFSFTTPTITNLEGSTYFETDVLISTQSSNFKLSSGQLYLNYNVSAFGTVSNADIEITYPSDTHLLGLMDNAAGVIRVYSNVISNENTPSRLSLAWQQERAENCIGQEVNTMPIPLLHLKIKFLPGAESLSPELCFESSALFVGQTYTACGISSGICNYQAPNCSEYSGSQIVDNTFDCSETSTNTAVENINSELIADFRFFSNPVTEEFSIDFMSFENWSATFTIKDLLGRELHNEDLEIITGQNKFNFSVKKYALGTYFFELYTKENVTFAAEKFTKIQ